MSDIQRYEVMDDGDLYMSPHGSLCMYDDHLVLVQDIYEPRIARLKASNELLSKELNAATAMLEEGS